MSERELRYPPGHPCAGEVKIPVVVEAMRNSKYPSYHKTSDGRVIVDFGDQRREATDADVNTTATTYVQRIERQRDGGR